jgi:hypothetical protein
MTEELGFDSGQREEIFRYSKRLRLALEHAQTAVYWYRRLLPRD